MFRQRVWDERGLLIEEESVALHIPKPDNLIGRGWDVGTAFVCVATKERDRVAKTNPFPTGWYPERNIYFARASRDLLVPNPPTCQELCLQAFEFGSEGLRRFVVGVLGDEFALDGEGEDGFAEVGGGMA